MGTDEAFSLTYPRFAEGLGMNVGKWLVCPRITGFSWTNDSFSPICPPKVGFRWTDNRYWSACPRKDGFRWMGDGIWPTCPLKAGSGWIELCKIAAKCGFRSSRWTGGSKNSRKMTLTVHRLDRKAQLTQKISSPGRGGPSPEPPAAQAGDIFCNAALTPGSPDGRKLLSAALKLAASSPSWRIKSFDVIYRQRREITSI